ncbi:MAG: AAA family ATPase [Nanoarchaeota archaeon]
MKPDLESVLKYLPWTQKSKWAFTATTNEEIIKVESPFYVVSGRIIDKSFQIGIYTPTDGLIYIPIGLSQTQFHDTAYYRYDHAYQWKKEDEKRDVVYLPLRKSSIRQDLVRENKAISGSPCFIYAINGTKYPFPLVILDENNDEGMRSQIFYRAANKSLSVYVSSPVESEASFRAHLRSLEKRVYSFTAHKLSDEEIIVKHIKIEKPAELARITGGDSTDPVSKKPEDLIDWNEPSSIKAYLDRSVIGQHAAKKTLAIAFSNYMAEIETKQSLPRGHVMLVGPTGSGKTMMISLLAKAANLPKVVTKLSMNTKEGYVGQSLSDSCMQIQAQTSEEDPYGLIVIDEIDKAAPALNSHNWGNELQDEIISLAEETSMKLTVNKEGHREDQWFNTKNLLFIAAGAFHGEEGMPSIYDIIAHRLGGGGDRKKIGFQTEGSVIDKEPSKLLEYLIPDDLVKFGLKPELVGRFSARAVLQQLTVDDKVRILNESDNSPIHYYQRLFDVKGYHLEISEAAKRVIAEACPAETGARALNQICIELFSEIIYQPKSFATSGVIVVDKDLAKELISKTEKSSTESSGE